ncbi:disease resistance RPP13-like protein 4 [Malania oleifera]|uniref:disease resistance RPP13-like protein 4 n=1 Tax=Malania oleifera TaxID=397392 RepID=UPI0025AEC6DF|nr:disease resistance RPP13-like protein 4 [Malania oleifera]XP_057956165.1 disease resistance RPP13-like protein 4 [Malania oleifera]XP_057956166.1 disease resistance RPP13-like protein 4 [Malania oleifera]
MLFRRKPEDVVPVLLRRLGEAKKRAVDPRREQTGEQVSVAPLFEKIEAELQGMKEWFPAFKHWETTLMVKFTDLERDIDDEIFDDRAQMDEIEAKLDSIDKKLGLIKENIALIHLPQIDDKRGESRQEVSSQALARKVSEDLQRLSVEEQILNSPGMADLQVSYDILDLQLKLCLLCLSIFPENSQIKKKPLIFFWIGESLITRTKNKTAEEVGEIIFEKLVKKGLIQPVPKSPRSPVVDSCKIHPWIRRMLISVATQSGFFDFNSSGELSYAFSKSRRACLVSGKQEELSSDSNNSKEEELLTLFNVNQQYIRFNADSFARLKKAVVLQLGRWQNSATHHIEVENSDFLDKLRDQKHLRYLSLQGVSRVTTLPSSITELINLEILDLKACHSLEKLPHDISRLRKLTHLDISECYLLEGIPKGIDKLHSLQVLKGLVIESSRRTSKLGDLAQLKKLRKLSLRFRSSGVNDERELERLKDMVSLHILTISWGKVVSLPMKWEGPKLSKASTFPSISTKSITFPPKLEKLDLRCFPHQRMPDWLRPSGGLEKLNKLYIRGGDLEDLGWKEGTKWNVKILRLKYLKKLNVDVPRLRENFPELIYLEKIQCFPGSQDYVDAL